MTCPNVVLHPTAARTRMAKYTRLTHDNNESPAFEAVALAPESFHQFSDEQNAAVYYVTLHIDGKTADNLEADMDDLRFAFAGFLEAVAHRQDEVGAISTPGLVVAIANHGEPPHVGHLTGRVTIQKLPLPKTVEEVEAEEGTKYGARANARASKRSGGKGKSRAKARADDDDES